MTQLQAFLLTLGIEVPLILLLARPHGAKRIAFVTLIAIGAQCLTHPVLWHMALIFSPHQYIGGVLCLEAGATVVEGLWYQLWLRPGMIRAMLWSLIANSASFGLGIVWQMLQ